MIGGRIDEEPGRRRRGGGPSAAPAVAVVVIASLLLSAHFLRSFAEPFVVFFLLLPLLLLVRRRWAARVVQVALVFGGFEWITTTVSMLGERRVTGEPAGRMLLIMSGVTGFTFLAAAALETAGARRRFGLRTGRMFQTAPAESGSGAGRASGDGARDGAAGSTESGRPPVPWVGPPPGVGPYSDDLAAVASFSAIFERPGFEAGSWVHPKPAADGAIQMSYWQPHPDVQRWHDSLYAHGLVLPDFDWAAEDWRGAMAGFQADPSALAAADLETVRKILTTAARADRFNEGYLGSLFEAGVAQAATRRLGVLAAGS